MRVIAYGDESGTHDGPDGSPYMILAGHVATLGKWNAFDNEWRKELKRAGIAYWHSTDYWGTEAGEKFAPKIVKLEKKHLLFGYVVKLSKEAYKNDYIAGLPLKKPQLDTMYGVCFRYLVGLLLTRVPLLLKRSDLNFSVVLESGAAGSRSVEGIVQALKKQLPTEAAALDGVKFGDKKNFPGLQIADALAFGALKMEEHPVPLFDLTEETTLRETSRAVVNRLPVFRQELDAGILGELKRDLLTLVDIRKRYAESVRT